MRPMYSGVSWLATKPGRTPLCLWFSYCFAFGLTRCSCFVMASSVLSSSPPCPTGWYHHRIACNCTSKMDLQDTFTMELFFQFSLHSWYLFSCIFATCYYVCLFHNPGMLNCWLRYRVITTFNTWFGVALFCFL